MVPGRTAQSRFAINRIVQLRLKNSTLKCRSRRYWYFDFHHRSFQPEIGQYIFFLYMYSTVPYMSHSISLVRHFPGPEPILSDTHVVYFSANGLRFHESQTEICEIHSGYIMKLSGFPKPNPGF